MKHGLLNLRIAAEAAVAQRSCRATPHHRVHYCLLKVQPVCPWATLFESARFEVAALAFAPMGDYIPSATAPQDMLARSSSTEQMRLC